MIYILYSSVLTIRQNLIVSCVVVSQIKKIADLGVFIVHGVVGHFMPAGVTESMHCYFTKLRDIHKFILIRALSTDN